MKELKHLEDIFENYDTFVIDLWGVMHNGVVLNPKAIEAVDQLKKNLKKIVFLSNAPRPSSKVINFLLKMKMDRKFLEHVITSGEAAMHAINQKKFGKTFYHLGPSRDNSVFEKVKDNRTDLQSCDFILCTGLFDDYDNDLNYFNTIKSVSLLNEIKIKNYDAIVDLNTNFCAASSMLFFDLDAPLKIGFDSLINRKIYTITLERKENAFLESYFSKILSLLGVKF